MARLIFLATCLAVAPAAFGQGDAVQTKVATTENANTSDQGMYVG